MTQYPKKPERKTFLQDRFDILIKRQKEGTATFNELTELDDIVNRDPTIREMVLEEMHEFDTPPNNQEQDEAAYSPVMEHRNLFSRLSSFITRVLTLKIVSVA